MTIRQAKPSDLYAICAIAEEAAEVYSNGRYRVSKKGIRNQIRGAISDAACLVLLDDEGSVLIATAQQMGWAERKVASLQMVKSAKCGRGRLLLRAFKNWCDSRMDIKAIHISVDGSIDPRFSKLLERIGVGKAGSFHAYTRS